MKPLPSTTLMFVESNYATFYSPKQITGYDMIKMSVKKFKDIIRPCGLSPMKRTYESHIYHKHNG
jgi:hypothetical protein